MRVALGTIEIDDDARKAIRKDLGQKGHATRGDAKEWAIGLVEKALSDALGRQVSVTEEKDEPKAETQADAEAAFSDKSDEELVGA